jgi:hypothetical protein
MFGTASLIPEIYRTRFQFEQLSDSSAYSDASTIQIISGYPEKIHYKSILLYIYSGRPHYLSQKKGG